MKKLNTLFFLFCAATLHAQTTSVDGKDDLEKKIKEHSHVVIKFWRPGCPACKKIENDFNRISNSINKGRDNKIVFLEIDTNKPKNKKVYPEWKVTGVPAIFFIKNGKRSNEIKRKKDFAKSFETDIRSHFDA